MPISLLLRSLLILILFAGPSSLVLAAAQQPAEPLPLPVSDVLSIEDAQLAPEFWIARLEQPDAVVLTPADIQAINARLLRAEPSLHDLAALPDTLPRQAVLGWIDGVSRLPREPLFDEEEQRYPEAMAAGWRQSLALDRLPERVTPRFGLIVRRAPLRTFPTELHAFATPGDLDIDRFQETAEFPGTPVAVVHESADGRWLFVLSPRYAAWVQRDFVALGSRAEVLGYATRAPFRVVTGARVETVYTPEAPQVSRRDFDMSSRFPLATGLAPDQPVNGQTAHASWAVTLPVRDPDGGLVFQPALVQKNADTSGGYLSYTRANLIRQAFKFLGERYGWGHDFNGRDCSGFVADVFASMGIVLPRNTGRQARSAGLVRRMFGPADSRADRLAAAQALAPGDLVYIPGHVMLVVGQLHGEPYVIHDVASVRQRAPDGRVVEVRLNGVAVTPLLPLLLDTQESYVDRITSIVRIGASAPPVAADAKPAGGPTLSPATTRAAAGLVDFQGLVPDIDLEMRYFGSHNFVGRPITGYRAPRCWLMPAAAAALARVEAGLRARRQRLRIFDCYRPARAVADFVRWMDDPTDLRGKAEFYPDLDKPQLSGVYIAPVSGHSRGGTVDLTILQCDAQGADCRPLDMGTGFDFFGTRAHTDSPEVTTQQRANRQLLRDAMTAQGFVNLPEEWWHYRLVPEPSPQVYYDVEITAP